jgi:hypothetical protein
MEISRSCNRTSARRHIRLAQLRSEEPKELVHAERAGRAEAEGAIEGVLAQPDGVAVAATLEVDRSHQVHLIEWLEARACAPGYSWRGSSGATDPGRGQTVALQDARDGRPAGERTDVQGLQLGTDGLGPYQTVASGRRGMGLEPAADGEDGPLQFGWDPLRVLVALGSGLHSGR